jgi:hypothetical protein
MPNALLRFAPEELYLLQRALRIEVLPGMKPDILEGFSEEQKREALACADHTLRARNWIGWQDAQQRVINPALATVLSDYASPLHTIFVDTQIGSKHVMPFLYVFGEQGIYEQCQPEDNVLQFRLLQDRQALVQRLSPRSIAEPATDSVGVRGKIKQCILTEGLKGIHKDIEITRLCFARSLPAILAADLALAYQQPRLVQYLACWDKTPSHDHTSPLVAFTILVGQKQTHVLWVEEPAQRDNAVVTIMPATSQLLAVCIEELLPPFIHP